MGWRNKHPKGLHQKYVDTDGKVGLGVVQWKDICSLQAHFYRCDSPGPP